MAGRLIAAVAALLLAPPLQAQLADPMRPPAAFGDRGAAAGAGDDSGSPLHVIILRRGGEPVAMLGGKRLTVGSRVGDARVVAISDSEVVLAGRSGRQVIKVNPDVDKKMRAAPAQRGTAPASASKGEATR